MTTRSIHGTLKWSLSRDSEGHRNYKLTIRVHTTDARDGPANILSLTPGLPIYGSPWVIDLDGNGSYLDVDVFAWCRHEAEVVPVIEKERVYYWDCTFTFSTKPSEAGETGACKDGQFEDPLFEPQRVSGSFVRQTEEATHDRFGKAILNSAREIVRGKQVEFDANKPQVVIEQNVPFLQLDLLTQMGDTLNDDWLWGVPPRCIKLSEPTWEKKFHGFCYPYYTRKFVFDIDVRLILDQDTGEVIDYKSGWDRDLLDEGTKCLRGDWNRDRNSSLYKFYTLEQGVNPPGDKASDFKRFKDWYGENSRVVLNGQGLPANTMVTFDGGGIGGSGDSGKIHVERYTESNFLVLGIPTQF